MNSAVLVRRSVFEDKRTRPTFIKNLQDSDMAFCEALRDKVRHHTKQFLKSKLLLTLFLQQGVFIYVSNRLDWGHLVDPANFNPEYVNPDFYEIMSNKWDWERRYIHPNYSQALQPDFKNLQVCNSFRTTAKVHMVDKIIDVLSM